MARAKKLKEGTRIVRPRDVATVVSDMGDWVSVRLSNGEYENWTRYKDADGPSFLEVSE
jgi:hypothetical protein